MNIGGLIFGAFCLLAVIVGIGYIIGVSATQSPITDTYGNGVGNTSNVSQGLVGTMTSTGDTSIVPLVLIVGVVIMCATIFAFYIASKLIT